jgi:hypothetical protein
MQIAAAADVKTEPIAIGPATNPDCCRKDQLDARAFFDAGRFAIGPGRSILTSDAATTFWTWIWRWRLS